MKTIITTSVIGLAIMCTFGATTVAAFITSLPLWVLLVASGFAAYAVIPVKREKGRFTSTAEAAEEDVALLTSEAEMQERSLLASWLRTAAAVTSAVTQICVFLGVAWALVAIGSVPAAYAVGIALVFGSVLHAGTKTLYRKARNARLHKAAPQNPEEIGEIDLTAAPVSKTGVVVE